MATQKRPKNGFRDRLSLNAGQSIVFCNTFGSVVKCLTLEGGAVGSSLTGITALCLWARHINPSLSTGLTQEDLSLYNWKIADGT